MNKKKKKVDKRDYNIQKKRSKRKTGRKKTKGGKRNEDILITEGNYGKKKGN